MDEGCVRILEDKKDEEEGRKSWPWTHQLQCPLSSMEKKPYQEA
jgi:hypothetical protein